MRFEVLMAVTVKIAFWDVMLHNIADLYQCFIGICCPDDGGSRFLERSIMMYQTKWHHIPEGSEVHIPFWYLTTLTNF
jgi:hypothetical protein